MLSVITAFARVKVDKTVTKIAVGTAPPLPLTQEPRPCLFRRDRDRVTLDTMSLRSRQGDLRRRRSSGISSGAVARAVFSVAFEIELVDCRSERARHARKRHTTIRPVTSAKNGSRCALSTDAPGRFEPLAIDLVSVARTMQKNHQDRAVNPPRRPPTPGFDTLTPGQEGAPCLRGLGTLASWRHTSVRSSNSIAKPTLL